MNTYDTAFAFWSLLSTEQEKLAGGVALANTDVPYFLSNAAWYPQVGELQGVAEWYAARGLPPALIAPSKREDALERALQEGPFRLEHAFTFREAAETPAESLVEQVDWRQTRYAGELLARHYEQPDLGLAIGSSLADAVQKYPPVQAFLSYRDDPVGAMVTFEHDDALIATLLADEGGGLETRLAQDAARRGLRGMVMELLPEGVTTGGGLERWVIN